MKLAATKECKYLLVFKLLCLVVAFIGYIYLTILIPTRYRSWVPQLVKKGVLGRLIFLAGTEALDDRPGCHGANKCIIWPSIYVWPLKVLALCPNLRGKWFIALQMFLVHMLPPKIRVLPDHFCLVTYYQLVRLRKCIKIGSTRNFNYRISWGYVAA